MAAASTESVISLSSATMMDTNSSNNTNNTDPYGYDHNMTMWFLHYLWTIVTPTVFVLIILIGTLGNSLVIYVIVSRQKMRTVTNILLLNLAISDIAFLLICVPFQAYKYASDAWPYGNWSCQVVQYFLYVTASVTVWTLTCIAATRFLIVVFSVQTARFRTRKNVFILCIIIWIIMLLVNIPIIFTHQINQVMYYSYCGSKPEYTKLLTILFFTFAYVVPLALICLLYLMIVLHLRANKATTFTSTRDRSARACKVIIIVIVVFCVSWAPNHVVSLLALWKIVPVSAYFEAFRVLFHCMAYSNSVANPIIYNYASEEFRKAFKEAICCGKWKESQRELGMTKKKTFITSDGGGAVNGECQSMIRDNNYDDTVLEP